MAHYMSKKRNESDPSFPPSSPSIREPKKAAGMIAQLPAKKYQKTNLLSNMFKRTEKADLGLINKQVLAGAESMMNGPAKSFEVYNVLKMTAALSHNHAGSIFYL